MRDEKLVERLRGAGEYRRKYYPPVTDIFDAAADEIERLRKDAAATRTALRQLLAALPENLPFWQEPLVIAVEAARALCVSEAPTKEDAC